MHLPPEWERCMRYFLESVSPRTASLYRSILVRFFSDPPRHPEAYSRADVEAFLRRPCRAQNSKSEIPSISAMNSRLAALRSFYSFAAQYTYAGLDGRPTVLLTRPAPTLGMHYGVPAQSYRSLSREDMAQLFAVIPTDTLEGLRARAICWLFFWTGRRRSELASLRRGDFEQMTFSENGYTRTGWVYRFYGKGKHHQEDRAECPLQAMEALRAYLKKRGRTFESMRPTEPLFIGLAPTEKGGRPTDPNEPLSADMLCRIVKKYARIAGIDVRGAPLHIWRHTAARTRHDAGVPITRIHELLRHGSLDMTYRYIRQLTGSQDDDAALVERHLASYSF